MEAQGGIGSVGSYDVKFSAGVIDVSLGAKVDVGDLLAKLLESGKISNAAEKLIISGAIVVLKAIP